MSEIQGQLARWLEELAVQNCSSHTIRAYAADLKGFPAFVQTIPIADIKVTHVREWLAWLYQAQISAVTIKRHIAACRGLFQFLKREGLIASNPARQVLTPKQPVTIPPAVMSPKQIGALIDGIEPASRLHGTWHTARDLAMIELLYGTGIRVSELAGLNVEDVDQTECWLLIRGKGKKDASHSDVSPGCKAAANSLRIIRVDPR